MEDFKKIIEYCSMLTERISYDDAVRVFKKYGVHANKLNSHELEKAFKRIYTNHKENKDDKEAIQKAYDVLNKPEADLPVSGLHPKDPANKTGIPAWAWAGHSSSAHPDHKIRIFDNTDSNFIKKKIYELSDKSELSDWTIYAFDGNSFRSKLTVYGSPVAFNDMAAAMVIFANRIHPKAIFIKKEGDNKIYMIWDHGRFHSTPIHFDCTGNPVGNLDLIYNIKKMGIFGK